MYIFRLCRLPPGGKRDVFVTFQPDKPGHCFEASLIVKPQSRSKVSLKGVIPLVAFSGKAHINLATGAGHKLTPEISTNGRELAIQASNSGDTTGFVKVSPMRLLYLYVPQV